jgi:hypothetical protein
VAVGAVAAVALVVAYYVITDTLSHPHEQTARYLPPDTQFYLSVNLRPGLDQLSKLKAQYAKFEANAGFGQKIDELFEK